MSVYASFKEYEYFNLKRCLVCQTKRDIPELLPKIWEYCHFVIRHWYYLRVFLQNMQNSSTNLLILVVGNWF